jgi:hypothetical protein
MISVKFESGNQTNKHPGSWTSEEVMRISKRTENWTPEGSEVWRTLQNIFGERIQLHALLDVAIRLSQEAGITLDRDAKRRKNVLIKWFEEHWDKIYPLLNQWIMNHQAET